MDLVRMDSLGLIKYLAVSVYLYGERLEILHHVILK